MFKIIKRISLIFGIMLASLIILFASLILFFNALRWNDLARQKRHLNNLKELYSQSYNPINEDAFVNFDLDVDNLRLNEIQMLASHNS